MKPKVIISTDIGGGDKDDAQSLIHALLYADKIDYRGIVLTSSDEPGVDGLTPTNAVIDAYAIDLPNLQQAGDYTDAEVLRSNVVQGATVETWPGEISAGAQHIIDEARAATPEDPVYLLAWGPVHDVARALFEAPDIVPNVRIYTITAAGQDKRNPEAYEWMNEAIATDPAYLDLFWINAAESFRGMYIDDQGTNDPNQNLDWVVENVAGQGALGTLFHDQFSYDLYFQGTTNGLKMGDTPSLLYLLDEISNDDPSLESWGGSFAPTGLGTNTWGDKPDAGLGDYDGAATVFQHREAVWADFAARLNIAQNGYEGDPVEGEGGDDGSPTTGDGTGDGDGTPTTGDGSGGGTDGEGSGEGDGTPTTGDGTGEGEGTPTTGDGSGGETDGGGSGEGEGTPTTGGGTGEGEGTPTTGDGSGGETDDGGSGEGEGTPTTGDGTGEGEGTPTTGDGSGGETDGEGSGEGEGTPATGDGSGEGEGTPTTGDGSSGETDGEGSGEGGGTPTTGDGTGDGEGTPTTGDGSGGETDGESSGEGEGTPTTGDGTGEGEGTPTNGDGTDGGDDGVPTTGGEDSGPTSDNGSSPDPILVFEDLGTDADNIFRGKPEADSFNGKGGNDRILGRGDDDTLAGGSGDDFVKGGAGDDALVYVANDNRDAIDEYEGSSGFDTLQIQVTQADLDSATLIADLAAFDAFVVANADTEINGGATFQFNHFDLSVRSVEAIEVVGIGGAPIASTPPPTAVDDAFDGTEDSDVTGDVLANDLPADGGELTASLVSGPDNGSLVFEADGSFTYRPDDDYFGADSFVYRTTEGSASATATVNLTIAGAQDAPVANADSGSVTQGRSVTIDVLSNDSDVDGDTLSVVSFTQGAAGGVTQAEDGRLIYAAGEDAPATDTFSYTLTDGTATATATVSLTIAEQGVVETVPLPSFEDFGSQSGEKLPGDENVDSFNGLGGDDIVLGRGDNDVLAGGGGNDFVKGGADDDRLIYVVEDNIGATDRYQGSKGTDTLDIYVTAETLVDLGLEQEVTEFRDFAADNFDLSVNGGSTFEFDALGLEVQSVEEINLFLYEIA